MVFFVGYSRASQPIIYSETPASGFYSTTAFKNEGYSIYLRDPLRIVWPESKPSKGEFSGKLSVKAAPGESIWIPIYIFAHEPIAALAVSKQSNSLIDRTGHMVYSQKKGHKSWGKQHSGLMDVPLYISDEWPTPVERGKTLSVWANIKVPAGLSAQVIKESLQILASNLPSQQFELSIEILPITLSPPQDHFLALYTWGRDRKKSYTDYLQDYQTMHAFGLTSIAIMAEVQERITVSQGKLNIQWAGKGSLHKAMEAFKSTGFNHPKVLWLMSGGDGGDLYRWCNSRNKPNSMSVKTCYQQLVSAVILYGKNNNWPELILQPVDEPFRDKRRLEIADQTYQWLSELPGIELEINNLNGPHTRKAHWDFYYNRSNYLTLSRGPYLKNFKFNQTNWDNFLQQSTHLNKKIWFYNADNTGWHPEIMRFWFGLGLWQSGANGFLQWSYQIDHMQRYIKNENAIYEPSRFYAFYYPKTQLHAGGPSLGLIGINQGINDLRYLITQDQLITKCLNGNSASTNTASKLASEFGQLLSKINFSTLATPWPVVGHWEEEQDSFSGLKVSGDYLTPNGLDISDYSLIRNKLIDNILQLQSLKGCQQ